VPPAGSTERAAVLLRQKSLPQSRKGAKKTWQANPRNLRGPYPSVASATSVHSEFAFAVVLLRVFVLLFEIFARHGDIPELTPPGRRDLRASVASATSVCSSS
jgi:hypothetical protein